MRVLVTGAGGFIGSHLCERLIRKNYDVRAFINLIYIMFKGDE